MCVRESMLGYVIAFLGAVTSFRVFIGQLLPLSGIDIASNLFMLALVEIDTRQLH